MFQVFLKDGSARQFDCSVTAQDVAKSISPTLAKKTLAVKVNNNLWDINRILPNNAKIELITQNTQEGFDILRHDTAHVFAGAVKELYPNTQITIGPSIENGFYYDIYREEPFTPHDLIKIEERMHDIVDRGESFVREEWNRDDCIKFFKNQGEYFKAEIIESIPQSEVVSIYKMGSFIDLCKGPHMLNTSDVGHSFKLTKIAGAYWRGNHKNPMLQRIYGTAWFNDEQLKNYLTMIEEAEKRDHRRLGIDLNLFHMQEEAQGSVFWHDKGWTLYRTLEAYIRQKLQKSGYIEVKTPQILDLSLWKSSGHWEKFGDNMFTVESEDKTLAIKPMSCPCHVQIFKQGIKSYRDLPLRMAEFGSCHRNEPSGGLHGLMRVRGFVQDDAHIFCTSDQIVTETKYFCDLLQNVYKDFGFSNIRVKFSDRPEVRAGTDATWDKAEKALTQSAETAGLKYTLNPGEGAFYGPKLEFVLRDAIGRDWQCGTLQVDFVLPERLDSHYIDEDGKRYKPVMLHRAIFGSFERFIGVLIEHYAGKFPVWLSPIQAIVVPITTESREYAKEIFNKMNTLGLRVQTDERNEKINYKIREHSLQKIPYIFVVGEREAQERNITIRELGGAPQKVMKIDEAINMLLALSQLPQ